MSGKSDSAPSLALRAHLGAAPGNSTPFALGPRRPPSPREPQLAPPAAKNPAGSCSRTPPRLNLETGASARALLSSGAPLQRAGPRGARIHRQEEKKLAFECADNNKDCQRRD